MKLRFWTVPAIGLSWAVAAVTLAAAPAGAVTLNVPNVAPAPPAAPATSPPTTGPHWHPHGAHRAPIDVTVTSPSRGCVVLYRSGGDISVKATHVNSGHGQIVTGVVFNAINPSGDAKASRTGWKVNNSEWHGAMHLASSSLPGNWTAVATIAKQSTNGNQTDYADTAFCVQRYAYNGYIRTSNTHPGTDQRYTVTAALMGLNAKGNAYQALPHRTVHLYWAPLTGGAQSLGWATTNDHGTWSKTLLGTGTAGNVYAVYNGSADYIPAVSDGLLEGVSLS